MAQFNVALGMISACILLLKLIVGSVHIERELVVMSYVLLLESQLARFYIAVYVVLLELIVVSPLHRTESLSGCC